jgi:hypothetical protein
MSRESRDFEISRLLELSRDQKYATAVAAFEVIEFLEQIEFPKKMQNRKPAVKAMAALSDGAIKWDYISDEARTALEEELGPSPRTELDIFGQAEEPPPPRPGRGPRAEARKDDEEEEDEFKDEFDDDDEPLLDDDDEEPEED